MPASPEARPWPWWTLYLPAPLLCLAIYWPSFSAWFQQDDFVWLGLLRDVHDFPSLLNALFHPSQHGTWRPLGERAFYLLSTWLFGWESLPHRIVLFATQIASLIMVTRIVLRITGSPLAATLAPVFWIVNSILTTAMISSGAYIHVLCAFCLLTALDCAIHERWLGAWAAFLIGFGAMETNVVFPALLTAYLLLFARANLRKVIPFWITSLAYFVLHMKLAPKMSGGSYAMHWDSSLWTTFATYWTMAFQPQNLTALTGLPAATNSAMQMVALALAIFLAAQLLRKQFHAVLFFGWFVILLSPVLPLAGHVTDYYLTIPLAALGMLGGWAFATAWHSGMALRATAVLLAALYLVPSMLAANAATRWWQQRSKVAEHLVRTVHTVHSANPGKIILLDGVTSEQFWAAVAHYPFIEAGKTYVFLTRETRPQIEPHPESGVILDEFFLNPESEERLQADDALLRFRLP
ncbi:MAG: hypothetical protein HY820_33695 [Acidobacteria bacterium]|nr:hypothetical protein [Acidobacteriota bacterium]